MIGEKGKKTDRVVFPFPLGFDSPVVVTSIDFGLGKVGPTFSDTQY